MEFITLPDEKLKATLSEDKSPVLGNSPKREAVLSNSQTEIEASDSCNVMPPDRSIFHHAPGRPKILRTGKSGHPRKEYGQVSTIMDCFETSPSIQKALSEPNKVAWFISVKEEYDTLIKAN
ncbi:hypothetical protein NPIL_35261 [Nephila pilipes]|uniref:Uncharacterized protein n=1 Tax=Nephila pilipes TaxID=299642 RepID=A0A8X6P2E2_NEPPI|nr:hypothetical protein NPIL_35261 [Nephila pilipes]